MSLPPLRKAPSVLYLPVAVFTACLATLLASVPGVLAGCPLTAPSLDTNPSFDVILTRTTPTLSFANARGGEGRRSYLLELDTSEAFDSQALRRMETKENPEGVTAVSLRIPLKDGRLWWWRVRAVDDEGVQGPWAVGRFLVDTASNNRFMGLVRAIPETVKVSSGADQKNLVDYSDQGLNTRWRATPPGNPHPWVELDMGRSVTVSRIWMLADADDSDGRPRDFRWLASDDHMTWREVPGGRVQDSDTYRVILDTAPTRARFWRLEITEWTGYAASLSEILLYSPAMPPIPDPPRAPYILVVGNQHDGFTFTELADRVRELVPELSTLTVPHHEVSMAMFNALEPKPAAIILSGNNADYNDLPMFEYNGEFELIRSAPVPILGICAGHQMLAFAHGYTRVRSMGSSDITAMEAPRGYTKIFQVEEDPLLAGMPDPFTAPEVHGWSVYEPAPGYEVVAESSYIQIQRSRDGTRHGLQFHPEIKVDYNQAVPVLERFLADALER